MAGTGLKIIVGLGVFALLSACGDKKPVEKDLPRVFVQAVKPADYAASVTLTGDVQARVQTELSFRVGGKIIQRMVDVGDRVSARQVLARLDPKDLQTNVDSAQVPGIGRRIGPEHFPDLVRVKADTDRTPHVRERVGVARI